MKKKKNIKKIIINNLPAAVALILMAVALAVTVKFNFFLSLLVLVILYFVFGIIIEFIIDKNNKKKSERPFYNPAPPEEDDDIPEPESMPELQPQTASVSTGGMIEEYDNITVIRRDEVQEEVQIQNEQSITDTSEFEPVQSIEEAVMSGAVADYKEDGENDNEQTGKETDGEGGKEIDFVAVKPLDDSEETEEPVESKEESSYKEPEGQKEEESTQNEIPSQSIDEKETGTQETAEKGSEEGYEQISFDSLMSGGLDDFIKARKAEDADYRPELKLEKQTEPKPEPKIEVRPVEEIKEDISSDLDIVLKPAAGLSEEVKEKAIEDAKEVIAPVIQAREEEESSLKTALENIGVETKEEVVPTAEAEARKSLFEDDEFEEANLPKAAPSIIFGSVPDTDDEEEYIPESSPADTPIIPQRGKVKVDSKKIDDLYSFNKANKGERFFGKSRKN